MRQSHIQLLPGFTAIYQNGNGAACTHSAPLCAIHPLPMRPSTRPPPFICEAGSQPSGDFAASTPLGLFDIGAMHPQVSAVEPWDPRDEGQHPVWFVFFFCSLPRLHSFLKAVSYDEQIALHKATSLRIIPFSHTPHLGFIRPHPHMASHTTPPLSNPPTSTLANYAGALPSPSPTTESLGNNTVIDART